MVPLQLPGSHGTSGGNAAGTAFSSGKAGLDATLVIAVLGMSIVYVGHRIRK